MDLESGKIILLSKITLQNDQTIDLPVGELPLPQQKMINSDQIYLQKVMPLIFNDRDFEGEELKKVVQSFFHILSSMAKRMTCELATETDLQTSSCP